MNFTDQINADLKEAMKSKDAAKLRAVRAIKQALLLAQTAEGGTIQLTKEKEIALVQKLVKQRQDSADIYKEQNRPELEQTEREEIAVLEHYLPTQLTDTELQHLLETIVAKVGATSAADMGKVMGAAKSEIEGRADNKKVAAIIKLLLSKQ
jgi:uncharacterized protein